MNNSSVPIISSQEGLPRSRQNRDIGESTLPPGELFGHVAGKRHGKKGRVLDEHALKERKKRENQQIPTGETHASSAARIRKVRANQQKRTSPAEWQKTEVSMERRTRQKK